MTQPAPALRVSIFRRVGRWATLIPVVCVLPAYVALLERGWQPLAATVALLALTMTLLLSLEWALPRGGLGVRPPGTLRVDTVYVLMSGALNVGVPMLVLAPLAAAGQRPGQARQLWPQDLPFWLDVVLFTLLADFVSYVWHRLEHDPRCPLLWRLHAVHHAPRYFDLMMGGHVHPLDVLVFVALTAGLGLLLGVPVGTIDATMLFAGVIGAIHHLDAETDLGWLNRVIPFADHHTVHHSRAPHENGNFGNITTIFDQLFGTWLPPRPFEPQPTGACSLVEDYPHTDLGFQLLSPFGWRWRRIKGKGVVVAPGTPPGVAPAAALAASVNHGGG